MLSWIFLMRCFPANWHWRKSGTCGSSAPLSYLFRNSKSRERKLSWLSFETCRSTGILQIRPNPTFKTGDKTLNIAWPLKWKVLSSDFVYCSLVCRGLFFQHLFQTLQTFWSFSSLKWWALVGVEELPFSAGNWHIFFSRLSATFVSFKGAMSPILVTLG